MAVRSEFSGGQVVGHQARVNRADPQGLMDLVGLTSDGLRRRSGGDKQ